MDHPSQLEFHELNEYVRHQIGVYYAWLSFFLAIVLGAMAWGLKASVNSKGVVDHFPVVFVVLFVFFEIQIFFGIRATCAVMDDIKRAESRAHKLLTIIGDAVADKAYATPERVVPAAYARTLRIARSALVANFIFWPVVAAGVLAAWYFCFSLGGLASPTEAP